MSVPKMLQKQVVRHSVARGEANDKVVRRHLDELEKLGAEGPKKVRIFGLSARKPRAAAKRKLYRRVKNPMVSQKAAQTEDLALRTLSEVFSYL